MQTTKLYCAKVKSDIMSDFTFAHLFVIKLRTEFNCNLRSPGLAPYIDEPVSLDDYLEAAEDLINNREIAHPSI